ncbi:MAG: carbamoyltransferase HypF [Rhodothermales bacterium]
MIEIDHIAVRRRRIDINGIVQGVGFRPFVYRLARQCGLAGFVNNSGDGVCVEVEGLSEDIERFCARLREEAPPLSRIVDVCFKDVVPDGVREFVIRASQRDALPVTLISPDVGICEDCLKELFDPCDRRYRYPFINCTNCGPRYTIVEGIPYDRPYTSMRVFEMCPDCDREYHNPENRRFHAQPNACPVCGPQVALHDNAGRRLDVEDPIEEVVAMLRKGAVVAIRGMGGFHLVVDTRNDEAVQTLRRRKGRAQKPFALMAPDVESVRSFCKVSPEEEKLLEQHTRPIVLLEALAGHGLAPSVAPGQRYLGFMLPYTPLHYLLVQGRFDALVMTSGNFTEEPIAIGNDEALERLASLADYFLLHDRDILQRCDDSIVRQGLGKPRLLRRSRGYVPAPIFLAKPTRKRILACGGELKNTVALSRGKEVFLSQHIGDLDNPSALAFFENSVDHLERILRIKPEIIAYDLHPEYLSTKWAMKQEGMPRIGVQHHHAHMASVMAEHGCYDPIIGIILDGTGYGLDGTIWGGEVLVGDASGFERHAWLKPVPMPGGTAAIKQPWRMALAVLYTAYGVEMTTLDLPFLESYRRGEVALIQRMIDRRINSPLTSSCGRLFDAASALVGLCSEINYEAQAAIALEMAVDVSVEEHYSAALANVVGSGALPVVPLIQAMVADIRRGVPVGAVAARFHRSVAEIFLRAAEAAREQHRLHRVGLSGGVFQNMQLFTMLVRRLQDRGFEVLAHSNVPTNDGGLALGQVVVADAMLANR